MERLSERLSAVESSLEKLEPNELLKRVSKLEDSLYTNKEVFNFEETCAYLGISESLLYKMTSSKEIPHYKPRGKNLFFAREELNAWLLQNYEPTISQVMESAKQATEVKPFFGQRRYGKRKRD